MSDGDSISKLSGFNGGFNLPMSAARAELQAKQISDKALQDAKRAAGKDSQADINKAATDFEAMLLQQMLGAMWETVPKGGLLSGSNEEGYFRDMLNEAMAKDIAEKQSIGVRDVIAKDINRIENRGQKK